MSVWFVEIQGKDGVWRIVGTVHHPNWLQADTAMQRRCRKTGDTYRVARYDRIPEDTVHAIISE